ncbi:MAG: hypothetical protein AAF125_02270 [Chloroflexota bacterium]
MKTDTTPTQPKVEDTIFGEIIARDVSEADYMAHYAGDGHEWKRGFVIAMSPNT